MTNESQSSQTGDATGDVIALDVTARFQQGAAMQDLYAQMRPDQRTALAGEFIRLLRLAGDDQVDLFHQRFQEHTQAASHTSPEASFKATDELLSAEQVAEIDQYVRRKHPALIEQMLQHPVTQAALRAPGEQATDEEGAPANTEKIMPTENVATSGAAYASGWMMMELGGAEADRLVEDPHELGAGPGGEIEREQRDLENEGAESTHPTMEQPERDS